MGRVLSRYLPLVVWLVFISFASSDSFNAGNTSRIIGPLVLWLFPNTSAETLATIHFITRKLAHFTEYAILGFLAARAFRPFPRWFMMTKSSVSPFLVLICPTSELAPPSVLLSVPVLAMTLPFQAGPVNRSSRVPGSIPATGMMSEGDNLFF